MKSVCISHHSPSCLQRFCSEHSGATCGWWPPNWTVQMFPADIRERLCGSECPEFCRLPVLQLAGQGEAGAGRPQPAPTEQYADSQQEREDRAASQTLLRLTQPRQRHRAPVTYQLWGARRNVQIRAASTLLPRTRGRRRAPGPGARGEQAQNATGPCPA